MKNSRQDKCLFLESSGFPANPDMLESAVRFKTEPYHQLFCFFLQAIANAKIKTLVEAQLHNTICAPTVDSLPHEYSDPW